jgi:hypothetical protein
MTCAHEACTCAVQDSTHCSDYCRDQVLGQGADHTCQCGHAECIGTP